MDRHERFVYEDWEGQSRSGQHNGQRSNWCLIYSCSEQERQSTRLCQCSMKKSSGLKEEDEETGIESGGRRKEKEEEKSDPQASLLSSTPSRHPG